MNAHKFFAKRDGWCHKGDFGKLLVIGGSRRYSGSPALQALAALRTGADLAMILAPERAADIAACFSPDIIAEPVKADFFGLQHLKYALKLSEEHDAVCIGGGLGKNKNTLMFVRSFLKKVPVPCVVDADAIKALNKNMKLKNEFILTPHAKEFEYLSGRTPGTKTEERKKQVTETAARLNTNILLKGHTDIISDGKTTKLNKTGSPYMTVGGTGDILAGVCGAMLAAGIKPFKAACMAAYINGLAGDTAAKEYRQGLLASDMLKFIPRAVMLSGQ